MAGLFPAASTPSRITTRRRSIPIIGYVSSPFAELPNYASIARFIAIPVLILSGFWMYAGVIFAVVGVAVWLGTIYLSGYGAAILSQVALFIARKTWLVIRARPGILQRPLAPPPRDDPRRLRLSEKKPNHNYTARFERDYYVENASRGEWINGAVAVDLQITIDGDGIPRIVSMKQKTQRKDKGTMQKR